MKIATLFTASAAVVASLAGTASAELIYGTTAQGFLVSFDSTAPGTTLNSVPVMGLGSNEVLVGLDYRAADGKLYGLGSFGNTYHVDTTGATTLLGSFAGINGSNFGYDWNPVVDAFRVVSETDQNLRVSTTGALISSDTDLAFGVGDVNFGTDADIISAAYTNNVVGATSTRLFGIASELNSLVRINPPNAGTLATVGPLGIDINARGGFDISSSGVAYLSGILAAESISKLWTVNLDTGQTTLLGQIDGGLELRTMTVVPSPAGFGAAALAAAGLIIRRRR